MAAYDNVSLAGPPNIATAGNYAQMLMQGLQDIGKAYQQGQQFQYQQRQNNLFQNGVPMTTNAQGQQVPDINAMTKQLLQSGGAPVAGQLLPMLQKQPFMDAALKEYQNDSGQPVNTAPAAASSASGPANITGQSPSRQPTQISETQGGDRINNLAADRGIDLDQFLGKYPGFRSLLNQDLTPGQAKAVTQRMDAMRGGGTSPQPNPVPQSGLQDEGNVNQQVPTGAAGGSGPISPAPTAASGNIGGAPSAGRQATPTFAERFAGGAPVTGGAAGMVPKGVDPLAYAQALKARAEALRRQSNTQGIIGIPTKAKEDQAAALDKQADAILEQLGKAGELTTQQKDVGSGAAQRGEEMKGEIASGQKELDGINKLGTEARVANQKVQLAKSFVNSDDYYSGPLEGINRRLKQYLSIPGDPNKALSQEAMVKSINDLLSEQIRAMAGSGVGRILLAEVQTMKDSIASQKITPATNRLLLEEIDRVHRAQMDIQDAANVYKQQHGHLDEGFQRQVADYYKRKPLFSQGELHDPRLIAPPVAPPGMDPVRAKLWAKSRGLNPGDPVRTQDGRIVGAP